MKTDYTHKYLQVEGHRLACLDEGTGPPVLLIHGIPTSSLLWREIIPTLARTHRVIAPDMLNYGQSDKPEHADVSIPEFLPLQEPDAEAAMSLTDFLDMLRGFLPQGVHRPEALTPEVMEEKPDEVGAVLADFLNAQTA